MPINVMIFNTILTTIIAALILALFAYLNRIVRRLVNKLEYIRIEQASMDYALEKSIGNGYSKDREQKRKELIEKSRFVNEKEYQG